tara:strand:+ start:46 stop:777 length:732 start_codon:yes stop_codon:yes gene_type:complete
MSKYILRLDDISANMNWTKFEKFVDIANNFQIKPIIAVIPDNMDEELLSYENRGINYFWNSIKTLDNQGWEIGIHGLNHLFHTQDSGLLGINDYAEFSGLDFSMQDRMIKESLKIFEKFNINTRLFVAPAHSFDNNTIKALRNNGIYIISDGFSMFPCKYEGITLVPQLFAHPRKMPFGFYTFCVHLNNISDSDFSKLEKFVVSNHKDFITLENALSLTTNSLVNSLTNQLFKRILNFKRKYL